MTDTPTPPAMAAEYRAELVARCRYSARSTHDDAAANQLEADGIAIATLTTKRDDLQAAYDDTKRLARMIDVAMHGEDGAAKQASLCDLVKPAEDLRIALTAAQAEITRLRAVIAKDAAQMIEDQHKMHKLAVAAQSLRSAVQIMRMHVVQVACSEFDATLAEIGGA